MNYLDQLQVGGPVAFVVIGLFALILLWITYAKIKGGMHKSQDVKLSQKENNDARPEPEPEKGQVSGIYIHLVKGIPSLDVTNIPKPLGDVYRTALSFAPKVGTQRYLVRENTDTEKIEDYDERKIPYEHKKSTGHAYLVNNCDDITKRFWSVDLKWWKTTSVWFAAGMMAILFISLLAVLGD